jgi:hypothetical protein
MRGGRQGVFGSLFHRWLLRTARLDDAYADAVAEHVVRAIRPDG